ncbi:MAG: hypothetical protein MUF21_02705 [Gemmatimonadaceae bacterium]|nr:hypothetical protein [Gemmatimonadaceae bacterium]
MPAQAIRAVGEAGVALGATLSLDPLAPLPRMWRGLQRRCDVLADVRHCVTLPGSDAHRMGNERDVILVSQRRTERSLADWRGADHDVDGWGRARRVAELAYRLAASDGRRVVLAVPPGRLTSAQRLLADACEREARQQRQEGVRTVKAGLLAALLSGDTGRQPLVVVSPMSMEELSSTVVAAIGDTGPWPVIAAGERVTFYDIPPVRGESASVVDPTGVLLAAVAMLQRQALVEPASGLLHALRLALAAEARMRGEDGRRLPVSADQFASAVIAHYGRHRVAPELPVASPEIDDEPLQPWDDEPVHGLRIRMRAEGDAASLRDAVQQLVVEHGLEVASVRPVDEDGESVDVRVRIRLGEAPLDDEHVGRVLGTIARRFRCQAITPWRDALGVTMPVTRPVRTSMVPLVAPLRPTGRLPRKAFAS